MADLEQAVHAALLGLGRQDEARAVQEYGFGHVQQDCEPIGVSAAKTHWSRIMRETKEGSAFLIAPHGRVDEGTLVISVARIAEILGDVAVRLKEESGPAPSATALLAPLAHLPTALENIALVSGDEDPFDLNAHESAEATA